MFLSDGQISFHTWISTKSHTKNYTFFFFASSKQKNPLSQKIYSQTEQIWKHWQKVSFEVFVSFVSS